MVQRWKLLRLAEIETDYLPFKKTPRELKRMFEINGLLFTFGLLFTLKLGLTERLTKITFKCYSFLENIRKFSQLNITSAFKNKHDTLHLYCLDKLSGSVFNLVTNDETGVLKPSSLTFTT